MLSEILALAKAGYKKKDIDEILELERKEIQQDPKETHKDEENLQVSKDAETKKEEDLHADKKDFEALYNENLKALGETQKKLALAERAINNQPVGSAGGKSQDDVLDELTKLLNR